MICCNECVFHPIKGIAKIRCPKPECGENCKNGLECKKFQPGRCFLDFYVISRLYQEDELAKELCWITVKKAVKARDRALLLSVCQAAGESLKFKIWHWLEQNEPRSIWLLNPLFRAAGLLPVESLKGLGSHRSIYLDALLADHYSGNCYRAVCMPASQKGGCL
ncbi:MAG: hypothetical protein ACQETH_16450 [Candidatus Rifleibacteriota bacterium]